MSIKVAHKKKNGRHFAACTKKKTVMAKWALMPEVAHAVKPSHADNFSAVISVATTAHAATVATSTPAYFRPSGSTTVTAPVRAGTTGKTSNLQAGVDPRKDKF